MTPRQPTITLHRQKLSEQIASYLEAEILEGRIAPGDQLPPERDLMDQFHVGRPSVREALFALQKKGLIAISSGSRARVIVPKPEFLLGELSSPIRYLLAAPEAQRHFQGIRTFFEIGLVRYAAVNATDDDLARLKQALRDNGAALDSMSEFQRTDIAFHFVLAEIPQNPIFVAIHNAVSDWLTEQRETTLQIAGQATIAFKAHAAIYEAVLSRDPDRAERAMSAHLEQLYEIYWGIKKNGTIGGDGSEQPGEQA